MSVTITFSNIVKTYTNIPNSITLQYIQCIAVWTNMHNVPTAISCQTQCRYIKEMYTRAQLSATLHFMKTRQLQCNNSLHNKCIFHFKTLKRGETVPYLQLSTYIHRGYVHSCSNRRKEHPLFSNLLLLFIYMSDVQWTQCIYVCKLGTQISQLTNKISVLKRKIYVMNMGLLYGSYESMADV